MYCNLFCFYVQIEQAWDALREVCGDEDLNQDSFDIENDLRLEKPVRIAMLDTGVMLDHEALIGRVARMRNFVPKWYQDDGHDDMAKDKGGYGTFCGALAVGGTYSAVPVGSIMREPFFQNGVAPFAKLAVGKVFNSERQGDVEWMIKGLRWACDLDKADCRTRRPVNADIVCLSVGMPRYHPGLRDVIYHAMKKGKVIVCCASNEEEENAYNIQYPARFGDVICVGSQTDNGQPTSFTPAGREIDFLGPGVDVWSASPTGPDHVTKHSGTWISSAYVAGVCALVLAYAEKIGKKFSVILVLTYKFAELLLLLLQCLEKICKTFSEIQVPIVPIMKTLVTYIQVCITISTVISVPCIFHTSIGLKEL